MITGRGVSLIGDLTVPNNAGGIIVFAHGSGSGRMSPRNRVVAHELVRGGFATLLFDLLTPEEEVAERYTRHLRFDIPLLANRLAGAIEWVQQQHELAELPIGLFGASTGAAAALIEGLAPGSPERLVSGEPVKAISRPSLVTWARRPLPKTGIPLTCWTNERWCVPSTST